MNTLKKADLSIVNQLSKNTMLETLGIEIIEIGDNYLIATMPVNSNTHQPMGLLHGGASAALIESVGSVGSSLLIDLTKEAPVGIEINANHVGSIRHGKVKAVGKIVHAGSRTHIWTVDIFNEETDALICTGRLTVMIIPSKK